MIYPWEQHTPRYMDLTGILWNETKIYVRTYVFCVVWVRSRQDNINLRYKFLTNICMNGCQSYWYCMSYNFWSSLSKKTLDATNVVIFNAFSASHLCKSLCTSYVEKNSQHSWTKHWIQQHMYKISSSWDNSNRLYLLHILWSWLFFNSIH